MTRGAALYDVIIWFDVRALLLWVVWVLYDKLVCADGQNHLLLGCTH